MARLIVQPGSPAAWEIQLKAGINSIGRGPANDFQLDDPSISGAHCQIVVDGGNAVIIDLGSTNGTYVNRARVREAALQPGQSIHLGGLELIFCADAMAHAGVAPPVTGPQAAPGGSPLPPSRAVGPAGVARVGTATTVALTAPPAALSAGRQAATTAPPVAFPTSAAPGSGPCKYHPKTAGRFFCSHCQLFFCDLCVTTRGQQKFCRTCGTECLPVQVQIQRPAAPKGFFTRLPEAFVFPFRGSGVLLLIVGTILLVAIKACGGMGGFGVRTGTAYRSGLGLGWWVLIVEVIVLGYLFTYMQCIVHSTAVGEEEMPPLPGISSFWEDIVLPFLQLMGLTAISFVPAIGVACWVIATQQESMGVLLLSVFALCCLYFPMAFLAVAMLDSVTAANPLLVIPSIFKVPLEYLVAIIALAGVLVIRALGDFMLGMLFPRGMVTHSIPKLLEMFAAQAFWSLVSLYLLTVSMRILGLLYVTKKDKLGWYNR